MINSLVKSWMTSPVVTVTAETNLTDARKLIDEKQIRALPVVQGEKLIGIITKRGLLRLDLSILGVESWNLGVDLADETVGDVMTKNPLTIRPESVIPKAARIMLENKITALPVLENGKMVGILTNSDLLRFILEEYPGLRKEILVKHYMTDEVVTIEKDTTLLEAHRLMGTKRIRSLPVLENEALVGLVTRTDLMSSDPSRLASRKNQEVSLKILTQPVEKVMNSPVLTISPEAELTEAAKLMLDNKIHSLPVVDQEKKMVGIITESDLFLMVVQKFF
ncbi:MAG: CBS domain-containing protein [Anaerolineaceae bacterium]|nr:CBS domain-containing protein [Anaerolineaceae bacterium]